MVTPVVTECAWHPQYFGKRQFLIKKRLPRGVTDAEIAAFIHDAMERGAITHGICGACKVKFQAELKARRANPNGRLRFKEVQATLRQLGISIRHDVYNREFRVTYLGVPQVRAESLAYYTSDLLDAYQTGIDMAKRGV